MVPGRSPFERLAAALGRVATVAPPDVAGELAASARSLRRHRPPARSRPTPSWSSSSTSSRSCSPRPSTTVSGGRSCRCSWTSPTGAPGVVRVVATLRADYFDRPLGYPGFGDAIKGRTVALGAMTAAELADAVRLPAAGVGIEIEPALVDRITTEAELQPGALPLVQHTMVELFARRETQHDHARRTRRSRRSRRRHRAAGRGDLRRFRRAPTETPPAACSSASSP